MRRLFRRVGSLSSLGLLAAGAALLQVSEGEAAPARLRVRVDRRLLGVGQTSRIVVDFLDEGYRPVPNDRMRSISVSSRSAGSGPVGSGDLVPGRVTSAAGAWSSSPIDFTARVPGRLTIRATSDGLAPGEELVMIPTKLASLLSRVLLPPVYADPVPAFQIVYPPDREGVPINGRSRAQLWVTLDPPLPADPQLRHVRVTTDPAASIVYKGTRTQGFADIVLDAETGASDAIDVTAEEPGRVRVSAFLASTGKTDTKDVEFKAPEPKKILIDPAQATVLSQQTLLPLTVRLGDQQGVEIDAIDHVHRIDLRSATKSRVTFDPPGVTLAPKKASAHAHLDLSGVATGSELVVLAEDGEHDLEPGLSRVKVTLAGYVLVLLAALGGALGGLARHVFRVGTPILWPTRVDGRLEPGAVGNVLSGALFGLFLFQAASLGLLTVASLNVGDNRTLAFFLGVMGGVGGILVVEGMVRRLLPEPKGEPVAANG
ncbi:MAG TPA: hypothetical protein VMT70_06930 [Vicinamibacteria bacterium]|nr:hypothetical protein [Vicinamibacteria bacterium]